MIRACLLAGAMLLIGGCVAVTVNVNFPQDTIDSAAAAIEDRVRTPDPAAPPPRTGTLAPVLRRPRARADGLVTRADEGGDGPK